MWFDSTFFRKRTTVKYVIDNNCSYVVINYNLINNNYTEKAKEVRTYGRQ